MMIRYSAGLLSLVVLVLLCGSRAPADELYPERAQDEIIIETVLRLDGFDLSSSAKAKTAVLRYMQHEAGSGRFFELARKFPLPETRSILLGLATAEPTETAGVEAARLLLTRGGNDLLDQTLAGEAETVERLITALGLTGEPEVIKLLLPLITDGDHDVAVRTAAARAIGRQTRGERKLLALVIAGKLPTDLTFAVANALHASADESIRNEAAKRLPLPATASAEPLPPLPDLVERQGDANRGHEVFRTVGTCANCHTVGSAGKEVGPDLSEIGDKLSREAMFVAILDPSAGISHNYETYHAVLDNGTIVSGIKLSETDESVTLRSAEAITRTIPRDEIEEFTKAQLSLMPADLQRTMTVQQLVDVVEYMTTLKKYDGADSAGVTSAE